MKERFGIILLLSLAVSCGTTRLSPVQQITETQTVAPSPTPVVEVTEKAVEAPPVAEKKEIPPKEEKKADTATELIAYARSFTGTPYRLGGRGPRDFDCSGFTTYVFRHFGYDIPPYSVTQFREGTEVESFADLRPGDLVFFGKKGSVRNIGHVGIIVSIDEERGAFNFIHASVAKGVTEESSVHPYFLMRYMGARRILED